MLTSQGRYIEHFIPSPDIVMVVIVLYQFCLQSRIIPALLGIFILYVPWMGKWGISFLMKSLLLLFRIHIFYIHVNCHFQCCYVCRFCCNCKAVEDADAQ